MLADLKCVAVKAVSDQVKRRDWYGVRCGSCDEEVNELIHFLFVNTLDCYIPNSCKIDRIVSDCGDGITVNPCDLTIVYIPPIYDPEYNAPEIEHEPTEINIQ